MADSPGLFPYFLLRIAGEAYADLRQTELPATSATIAEMFRCQDDIQELAGTTSEALYTAIPRIDDAGIRRLWINARRDIHNQKPLSRIPKAAYLELPQPVRQKLRRYSRLHTQLESLKQTAGQQYDREMVSAKRTFAVLLRSVNLQNGLLLSSSTIGTSLDKYLQEAPAGKSVITKKERSFMEYLSRMYTKPSPFSSFTHLAMGAFSNDDHNTGDVLLDYPTSEITSHIQLNHELYKYLFGLLMGRREIRQHLPITLNHTLNKTDGTYTFLTNHHNQEAFQRIKATSALDVFCTLAARAPQPVTYQELASEAVSKKYINASEEEAVQYIGQLIELGLFELELGVSGIDRQWDEKLVKQLSPFVAHWPPLTKVLEGLVAVRKLAIRYETAAPAKRRQLLDQAFQTFKSTCEILGATPPGQAKEASQLKDTIFRRSYSTELNLEPHHLWYEDTALTAQAQLSDRLRPGLQTLSDLLSRLGRFDGCQAEQEKMASFYQDTYGAAATVSLLQFYQDYSRKDDSADEHKIKATGRREKANQKALDVFWKHVETQTSTDEICFDHRAIAHLKPPSSPVSLAAFVQAFIDKGSPRLTLNMTIEGYGKMFSRFLYLFNDDVTGQLQEAGNMWGKDVLRAEVTDASFFNANLHPRLMPYEIITPGGHAALPRSAQLYVNQLVVSRRIGGEGLMLTHQPSGKEVIVFDLGFQGKRGRSRLYSLLCTFGPGLHHNANALVSRINRQRETKTDQLSVLPRIVYENRIVLQRKTWQVPKKMLPLHRSSETDQAYFLRLNQWRQSLQLPDEVFVKGQQRKPQYISFRNPFLVALFESSAHNCEDGLRIEEMLPHGGQLGATGGRVTEFLAQWEYPGRF